MLRQPRMKACSSSTVLFLWPTSPISPPTDIVIALRLPLADERRDLGAALEVVALLLLEGRPGEVHQRGGVHVDVVEARRDLLGDQLLDLAHLPLGVGGVLLGVDLAVVALDEEGEGVALAQRRADDDRHIFVGPLVGVGDLAAGDLEDDGPRPARQRRPEDRARGVVGQHPDVDGRDGEAAALAAAARQVEVVDGGRPRPGDLPQLPEEPAGRLALRLAPEDRLAHQEVGGGPAQRRGVGELDAAGDQGHGAAEEAGGGSQVIGHESRPRKWGQGRVAKSRPPAAPAPNALRRCRRRRPAPASGASYPTRPSAPKVSRLPSSTPGWSKGFTPYQHPAYPVASWKNISSSPTASGERSGSAMRAVHPAHAGQRRRRWPRTPR